MQKLIFFLIILFANLKVFTIFGKAFTFSEMMIILSEFFFIVLLSFRKTRLKMKSILLFIVSIITIPLFSCYISCDLAEGIKSYILLLLSSSYAFILYLYIKNTPSESVKYTYIDTFIFACVVLSLFGIFQSLYFRVLGYSNSSVVYPFSDYTAQFQSLYNTITRESWRSNSLYYEPSLFGLYTLYAYLLTQHSIKMNKTLFKIVLVLGLITSFSTIAYLSFLVCFIVRYRHKFFKIMTKPIYLFTMLLLIIVVLLTITGIENSNYIFNNIFNSITIAFLRTSELGVSGTSGYYRIIAPYQLAKYILANEYLGTGIGSAEVFIQKKAPKGISNYFQKGDSIGTSIDNTVMVIIIQYGYVGILFLCMIAYFLYRLIGKLDLSVIVFIAIFHFSSGHLYTMYYWIIYVPIIAVYYCKDTDKLGKRFANRIDPRLKLEQR